MWCLVRINALQPFLWKGEMDRLTCPLKPSKWQKWSQNVPQGSRSYLEVLQNETFQVTYAHPTEHERRPQSPPASHSASLFPSIGGGGETRAHCINDCSPAQAGSALPEWPPPPHWNQEMGVSPPPQTSIPALQSPYTHGAPSIWSPISGEGWTWWVSSSSGGGMFCERGDEEDWRALADTSSSPTHIGKETGAAELHSWSVLLPLIPLWGEAGGKWSHIGCSCTSLHAAVVVRSAPVREYGMGPYMCPWLKHSIFEALQILPLSILAVWV